MDVQGAERQGTRGNGGAPHDGKGRLLGEREHLQLLLDVTNALALKVDLCDLVTSLSSALRWAIPHAFMGLALHEAASAALVLRAAASGSANGHQNGHHHQGKR